MAWKFALFVSSFYVISLYAFVPSNVKSLPRDHPLHMKYRMAAVSIATVLDVFLAFIVNPKFLSNLTFLPFLKTIYCSSATAALMLIFYLGPFCSSVLLLLIQSRWNVSPIGELRQKLTPTSVVYELSQKLLKEWVDEDKLVLFRNLIFAPVTEEIVFRGLVVTFLYLDSDSSNDQTLTLALSSTVYFGLAHVHHFYEKIRFGNQLISEALFSTLIQFLYTSIFGFTAAILFIRTGNIFAPIISHIICNYTGLPNLGFMQPRTNTYSVLYDYRFILLVLHALGLIFFSVLLYPFTKLFAAESVFLHR